ncbi:response regulator [Salinicola socius]|uniref:DNA-binding response regulator n=1 Tax=Salinicola socius TaxID=404433 RepID=A0A1Q8SWM7_9GAMM|nr:response regulator transcription factor [Salinicola socius]OLO05814.1 DNA-binding response regulator [Salinicola socius]
MPPAHLPIRVLVVDDHPLLIEGIAAVIAGQPDIELVGEASNGIEAIDSYRRLQPDVTLMDLQMPELDGIAAIRAIRDEFPAARIAILTTYQGDVRVLHAIQAGATGYLLKSTLRKSLVDTIRALAMGKTHFPAEIASDLASHLGAEPLSRREVEVLRWIAQGDSNKAIARRLGLTEETIKAHVKNLIAKLNAGNRTHAVAIALRRGIIDMA